MSLKIQVSPSFPAPPLGPSIIVVTATPFTIPTTANEILVNVPTAAILMLPDAVAWLIRNPSADLLLKDVSGAALNNNITINRVGSNTIDGLSNIVIGSNYGFYALRVASNNWIVVR